MKWYKLMAFSMIPAEQLWSWPIYLKSPLFRYLFLAYLGGVGGGGGMWDLANPTHATIPTARITHPNMSYFRSLLFFFFAVWEQVTSKQLEYEETRINILHQFEYKFVDPEMNVKVGEAWWVSQSLLFFFSLPIISLKYIVLHFNLNARKLLDSVKSMKHKHY